MAVDAVDGRALERLRRRVERLEHAERRELDRRDGEAVRPLGEEVDERLHLRQLRHGAQSVIRSRRRTARTRGLLVGRDGLARPCRRRSSDAEHPVPVGCREGRHRARRPRADRRVDLHRVGQHLLGRRQVPDADGVDPVGPRLGEVGVDLRVVLAVVADEQPRDVGEVAGEPVEAGALVRLAAAEPAGVGRAPVGEHERAEGEAVLDEEAVEGRRGVPGARRDVDDGRAGVRRQDAAVHRGHAGHRVTGLAPAHEGVERRDHRAGQHRRDDGVVDVADDAVRHAVGDDEDVGRDRVGALHLDDDLLPPGGEPVVAGDDVDVTAAVGPAVDLAVARRDLDRDARRGRGEEGAPAAVVVGRAEGAGRVLTALGALDVPRGPCARAGSARRPGRRTDEP